MQQNIVFPNESEGTITQRHFNLSIPITANYASQVMNASKFVPRGCDDGDYCEESNDYPDDESVKEIVKSLGDTKITELLFNELSSLDSVKGKKKLPVPITYENFDDISSRLNPEIVGSIITEGDTAEIPESRNPWDEDEYLRESPICDSVESYIRPRTARARSGQWRCSHNLLSLFY